MPKFQFQSPGGDTLTLEADRLPSEEELTQIFDNHAGPASEADIGNSQSAPAKAELPPSMWVGTSEFAGERSDTLPSLSGMKEAAGQALTGMGNLAEGVLGDAASLASRFKRPDNYKVGALPSLSAITRAVKENAPYANASSGNILAALQDKPLPIRGQVAEAAGEEGGMPSAVAGHVALGLAHTAPLLAAGALPAAAQKLVAAGFTIDMMRKAPALFDSYAEEINKPKEEQDPDKIANLQSDIIQTFAFAPALAAHTAKSGAGLAGDIKYALDAAREGTPGGRLPIDVEAFNRASKGGESNASEVTKAAEVHGDVRPSEQGGQPEGVRQDTGEGSPGVQQKAEGGLLDPVEQDFTDKARGLGYTGDVEWVDNPEPGSKLDRGWAIWNDELGRVQVNRKAWMEATPEQRATELRGIPSEEAIHSHTTPQEAKAYAENATEAERRIDKAIYGAGVSGLKLNSTELGYEMLRMRLQRLNRLNITEVPQFAKSGQITVKALELISKAIQLGRKVANTKGYRAQMDALRSVSEKIEVAKKTLEAKKGKGKPAKAEPTEPSPFDQPALPLGETKSTAPERNVPLPREPAKAAAAPEMKQPELGINQTRDERIKELGGKKVLSDADAAELSRLRIARDKQEAGQFSAPMRNANQVLEAEKGTDDFGAEDLILMPDSEVNKLFAATEPGGARAYVPQYASVLWGAKQPMSALPRVEQLAQQAHKTMMAEMMKGPAMDAAKFGAEQGRALWLRGAIEGIKHEGGNYRSAMEKSGQPVGAAAPRRRATGTNEKLQDLSDVVNKKFSMFAGIQPSRENLKFWMSDLPKGHSAEDVKLHDITRKSLDKQAYSDPEIADAYLKAIHSLEDSGDRKVHGHDFGEYRNRIDNAKDLSEAQDELKKIVDPIHDKVRSNLRKIYGPIKSAESEPLYKEGRELLSASNRLEDYVASRWGGPDEQSFAASPRRSQNNQEVFIARSGPHQGDHIRVMMDDETGDWFATRQGPLEPDGSLSPRYESRRYSTKQEAIAAAQGGHDRFSKLYTEWGQQNTTLGDQTFQPGYPLSEHPDISGHEFAAPRRGMSDREARLAEQRRRLAEMHAAAKGQEFPEELKTQPKSGVLGGGEAAPVPAEQRVTTEAGGALPRLNPQEVEQKLDEHLAGEITPKKITTDMMDFVAFSKWMRRTKAVELRGVKPEKRLDYIRAKWANPETNSEFMQSKGPRQRYNRPEFRSFRRWVKNNVADVAPDQIRKMWEDAVWGQLLHATPERLAQWRDALGLTVKYGKGVIAPERGIAEKAEAERTSSAGSAAEANQIAKDLNLQGRLRRAQDLKGIEAGQRYRNKIISAAARKLIGESVEDRAELARKDVGIDDVDFNNSDSEFGGYSELKVNDLSTVHAGGTTTYDKLNRILRDQARASKHDPVSNSRRLLVTIDQKGKVHVVSTFNDAGTQRVTDPAGARLPGKPNRELNKGFVNQFRPIATLLLKDPVKGFHKEFDTLSDFNDYIGKEAHQHMQAGEFWGEATQPVRFSAEGTEGLEGEGGGFRGPHRGEVNELGSGTWESSNPVTDVEVAAVFDQIEGEVGRMQSADDIGLAIVGLADKAQRGRLTNADRQAVNAYRKMFDAVIERQDKYNQRWPEGSPRRKNLTDQEVLEIIANEISNNHATATSFPDFVERTMAEFGARNPENAWSEAPQPAVGARGSLPAGRRAADLTPGQREIPMPMQGPEAPALTEAKERFSEWRKGRAEINYERQRETGLRTQRSELGRRAELEKRKQVRERIFRKHKIIAPSDVVESVIQQSPGTLGSKVSEINRNVDRLEKRNADLGTTGAAALRRTKQIIMPDTDRPVPRFIGNLNEALTQAMGLERVPLIGKLWGERARIRNDVDKEVVGYSVKRAIGNSQAAITGARMSALSEKLGTPFKQDKDGAITNLNAAPDQSRFPSDVFEDWQKQTIVPEKMYASRKFSDAEVAAYSEKHPTTIYLEPNQERFFRAMLQTVEDGYKYLEEKNANLEEYNGESMETRRDQLTMHGLPKGVEVYPFPRVALYKRSVGPVKTELQRRIGGQYKVERDRLYKREEHGQPTTAYEPDMSKRLTTFVQRVYKAVADADIANSKALKGQTPEQRIGPLSKQYEADLRSGRMKTQDIADMSHNPRLGIEGQVVGHPAFAGKVYPLDVANRLTRAFGEQSHRWVRTASEVSKLSKALMLTGDLAQYLQQGSVIMFRNPRIWALATAKSLKAIADKNVTGNYLLNPDNMKAATEFIHSGGSLGHLQDFMAGAQHGEIATNLPQLARDLPNAARQIENPYLRAGAEVAAHVVKYPATAVGHVANQVIERSGRAFGTFQDMAKIEMWKALRETTDRREWAGVVETIENTVLQGRMESAGLNHARSTGERIMLMASGYYRGAINLVAGMAEGGVAGAEARKALASYAASITTLMVGSYLLAGMGWDEIKKRLTPGQDNRKFLKFPVKIGNDTVEVGPGGIIMSLFNLMADVTKSTLTSPKDMVSLGEKNPMIKWLTQRLGPIPGFVRKVATGADAFGRPVTPVEAMASMGFPIPVQKGYQAGQSANKPAAALSSAASFVGVDSARPSSSGEMHELATKFMKDEGLLKTSGWDEVQNEDPSFTKLRAATSSGSQSKFNDLYKAMSESRSDSAIIASMRKWRDMPFTGSHKTEAMFRASLNSYEEDLYDKAREEKANIYEDFVEMLANAK